MLKVEPVASLTIYSYTFASLSVDLLQSSLLVDIQIATWLNNYFIMLINLHMNCMILDLSFQDWNYYLIQRAIPCTRARVIKSIVETRKHPMCNFS